GHVDLHEHGLAAGGLDRGHGLGTAVVAPVGDDDARALLGEQHRGHAAHAVAGAGDERDLAVESGHRILRAERCGGAVRRAGSLGWRAGPDEAGAEASSSDPDEPDASETEEQLRDQRRQRLAKLDALRADGVDPYPVRFDADTTAGALRAEYGDLEPGTD